MFNFMLRCNIISPHSKAIRLGASARRGQGERDCPLAWGRKLRTSLFHEQENQDATFQRTKSPSDLRREAWHAGGCGAGRHRNTERVVAARLPSRGYERRALDFPPRSLDCEADVKRGDIELNRKVEPVAYGPARIWSAKAGRLPFIEYQADAR